MRKQIKIPELTNAISEVIKKIFTERGVTYLELNNAYFTEMGKNLGLERYTSTDHNITCSKLFAICDFFEISMSDFFKMLEEENEILKFNSSRKGQLVKKAYKDLDQ